MKSPIEIMKFIKAGEAYRLNLGTKNSLAAQLKKDEACVVFHAIYDDHEGHVSQYPTIMMLHWSKEWDGKDFRTLLPNLLASVTNVREGMGMEHDIKVYIVVHPENSPGITEEIKKAIAKIAKDLFISSTHKSENKEDLKDIKNWIDVEKIPVYPFETFKVNSFGKAVAIAPPSMQDKPAMKENKSHKSVVLGPFRKFF